jgi:hypothetical protein
MVDSPQVTIPVDLEHLEEGVRRCIVELLNLVQSQQRELEKLRAEVKGLREENARLKGEKLQGGSGPEGKETTGRGTRLRSSEKQRKQPKKRVQSARCVPVDRTVPVRMSPQELPKDAEFKGYERTVIQDLVIQRDNVEFDREKYYSVSEGKTYLAPLPPEYEGYKFGPGVRSWVLVFYYASGMSEPKIREVLQNVGVEISAGEVSNLLIANQQLFHDETTELFDAGLESTPWQQMDDTGTHMDGEHWHCHVVCNPFYTVYCTMPSKDRSTVVEVLRNGRPLLYRINSDVIQALSDKRLGVRWLSGLEKMPQDLDLTEDGLEQLLDRNLGAMSKGVWEKIEQECLLAGYQNGQDGPVVRALLTDGARTFDGVTEEHGLCWIHMGRLFAGLTPVVELFQQELDGFLDRYWAYYRELLDYKKAPSLGEAQRLSVEFDALFSTRGTYQDLSDQIERAQKDKAKLLLVLVHPEIPLHNNEAELGARGRVRKRDVSFGPRTIEGAKAWDTHQSLIGTCKKLGVNFCDYIQDRLRGLNHIPRLADLILDKASELALGTSW